MRVFKIYKSNQVINVKCLVFTQVNFTQIGFRKNIPFYFVENRLYPNELIFVWRKWAMSVLFQGFTVYIYLLILNT